MRLMKKLISLSLFPFGLTLAFTSVAQAAYPPQVLNCTASGKVEDITQIVVTSNGAGTYTVKTTTDENETKLDSGFSLDGATSLDQSALVIEADTIDNFTREDIQLLHHDDGSYQLVQTSYGTDPDSMRPTVVLATDTTVTCKIISAQ
jgi:hypothetical protein